MAEYSDSNKEINPFLSSLEGDNLEDSADSINDLDIPAEDEVADEMPTLSPFAHKLQKKKKKAFVVKPNRLALFLFLIGTIALSVWIIKANFFFNEPEDIDFTLPEPEEIDNTIKLSAPPPPLTASIQIPVIIEEKIKPTLVAPNKVGRGEFYLDLDICSFEECTKRYESILAQANFPIERRVSNKTFYLLRLNSTKSFHADGVLPYISQINQLTDGQIKAAFVSNKASSGKGIISVGLFTTVQKAKEVKRILERAPALQKKISFKITQVAHSQKSTHIYSGPFTDLKTANYILAEINSTTPIKEGKVVRLKN
ncbi:MAG: hypothetical protein JJV97_04075 [SAR324 cluster bacterium]|nr:hypothetical protein [SAR324 cluster bacterium]